MNARTPISTFVLSILFLSAALGQVVERADFQRPKGSLPGELRCEKSIIISEGVTVSAVIEVTAKGNGILQLGSERLRIWDEHDDGQVFVGGLLHVEFVDITGDGSKDLVICGTVKHTGEKESEPTKTEPLTVIYAFVPKTAAFALRYQCGPSLNVR
jgi:hypothetical protein